MERINKALQDARQASELHTILEAFFVAQLANTIADMRVCAHDELLDNRAYLQALNRLENELLEYTNHYNFVELRRQHVRE